MAVGQCNTEIPLGTEPLAKFAFVPVVIEARIRKALFERMKSRVRVSHDFKSSLRAVNVRRGYATKLLEIEHFRIVGNGGSEENPVHRTHGVDQFMESRIRQMGRYNTI